MKLFSWKHFSWDNFFEASFGFCDNSFLKKLYFLQNLYFWTNFIIWDKLRFLRQFWFIIFETKLILQSSFYETNFFLWKTSYLRQILFSLDKLHILRQTFPFLWKNSFLETNPLSWQIALKDKIFRDNLLILRQSP